MCYLGRRPVSIKLNIWIIIAIVLNFRRMSLNRVRCRLSFNSPKEQSNNGEGPSTSSSVSSVAANSAVKEQVQTLQCTKYDLSS